MIEIKKPTKEEMLKRFDDLVGYTTRDKSSSILKERDALDKAIRRLIENMDKRVSKKFVEKWTEKFSGLTDDYSAEILLERMFDELGHEIEEKEGGGE